MPRCFSNHGLIVIFSLTLACATSQDAKADGDIVRGEQLFKQCVACHSITESKNKVGPHLIKVVGRKPASVEGFAYSPKMKEFAQSAPIWDEATLDRYLENPRKLVPGTKMAFGGLKKPEDRVDLIAYLKSK